jgi:hypothetical protein
MDLTRIDKKDVVPIRMSKLKRIYIISNKINGYNRSKKEYQTKNE